MNLENTRKPYDACLPPANCHHELYNRLEAASDASGLSKAEIIRQALEKFLPGNSTNMEIEINKNGMESGVPHANPN